MSFSDDRDGANYHSECYESESLTLRACFWRSKTRSSHDSRLYVPLLKPILCGQGLAVFLVTLTRLGQWLNFVSVLLIRAVLLIQIFRITALHLPKTTHLSLKSDGERLSITPIMIGGMCMLSPCCRNLFLPCKYYAPPDYHQYATTESDKTSQL